MLPNNVDIENKIILQTINKNDNCRFAEKISGFKY